MTRSRFTPETRGAILQGVYAGLTVKEAATAAGVPVQTVKGWLTRGRGEHGTDHALFVAAVEHARDVTSLRDMEDAEFMGHLNRAVRAGSVSAMRMWWRINHGQDGKADDAGLPDPFSALDALDATSFPQLAGAGAGPGGNGRRGKP